MNTTKLLMRLQKQSPSILIGAGIVGVIAATVKACKATKVATPVIEELKEDLENAKDKGDEAKKIKYECYVRTGKELTKIYGPTVILGIASISMIVGSHIILNKRNAALAAALTTVNGAFKDYRRNVIRELGADADEKFRLGKQIVEKEVEYTDKKGNKKTRIDKQEVADPEAKGHGWLRYITPSSPFWNDDELMMEAWFNREQMYSNELLRIHKRFVIDQLWEKLGIVVTDMEAADAMIMGWGEGDYIELNVSKVMIPDQNGNLTPAYAVDPNVQRNVVKHLNKKKVEALKKLAA